MRVIYKIANQIIARAFYALFFLVPLVFTPFNFELFEFPKMLFTYAITVIIVSAWVTKSIVAGKFIFRRTLLDIPLLLFLSSQLLATVYSIDPHTSIWGYYSRSHGGLLSTISYLLLYWAYVSNMDYKKTRASILYLLSSAAIVAVWGIFEHFGKSPSCLILRGNFDTSCWIQDAQARVFATLGQPNWLAAWLVAIMPLTWAITISKSKYQILNIQSGDFLQKCKNQKFWIGTVVSTLLFAALLFTKSRSGLLGFGVAYTVFWAISFLHSIKQALRPFLIFTFLFLILALAFGTPWTSTSLERRAPDTVIKTESGTVLEVGGTESGDIRRIVWRGALNIWKAYPIFGSGVETFAYSYYQFRPVEHNLTSEWDFLYNKAHNEYLNYLATTGTVGLSVYFFLIGAVFSLFLKTMWDVRGGKIEDEMGNGISHLSLQNPASHLTLLASLLAGYASILVTNFFGFSVVTTATLFFLFPAMAITLSSKYNAVSIMGRTHGKRHILLLPVLLSTFYILLRLVQIWQADTFYAKATELNNAGESLAATGAAEKAVALRPDEPLYYNELAKSLGSVAVSLAETAEQAEAISFTERAIEVQDRAVTISPMNLNFMKARANLFFDLTSIDSKYLEDAILTLEQALEIAPTEPKILYNLGVLYEHSGETEIASQVLKRALELKPNYEDAQVALREINEN